MGTDRPAQIESILDEALAAITANDWAAAENAVIRIETILATIPDYETGTQSANYRETVSNLRAAITRQKTSAGGIQETKVEYTRATD